MPANSLAGVVTSYWSWWVGGIKNEKGGFGGEHERF